VPGRTVRRWLQRGREASDRQAAGDRLDRREQMYAALVGPAREARARSEVRALSVIQRGAVDGSWQAAAWYLEHVFAEKDSLRRGGPAVAPSTAATSAAEPPRVLRVVRGSV
jgi:hypothetical protein